MRILQTLMLFWVLIPDTKGEKHCNENCAVCEGGRCRSCIYGWYGHNCNTECQNCWITGCHKHSGICDQCTPGRYTKHCEVPCPDNCRLDRRGEVYCRRENGVCLNGCKHGWWGNTCNMTCSQNCEFGACLQSNGHCIGDCLVGSWGSSCEGKCPLGCRSNKCELFNGKCSNGCRYGWHGDYCDIECSDGCLNNACEKGGECKVGCKTGNTGRRCDEKCDSRCSKCHQFTRECIKCHMSLYGSDCTEECSMNCQNSECDISGRCIRGCIDGFTGRTCNKTCPFNCLICEQDTDICFKCKAGWTGRICQQQKLETPIDGTGVRLDNTQQMLLICLTTYLSLTCV